MEFQHNSLLLVAKPQPTTDTPATSASNTPCVAGGFATSVPVAGAKKPRFDSGCPPLFSQGYPIVLIAENGFPEIYHPSETRLQLCETHHLLLLSPWTYQYCPANENITIAQCKTMNCITQAICKLKDDWWK